MKSDKKLMVRDCDGEGHFIDIDNIETILQDKPFNHTKPFSTIVFKEMVNNLLDVKTYELEASLKMRIKDIQS